MSKITYVPYLVNRKHPEKSLFKLYISFLSRVLAFSFCLLCIFDPEREEGKKGLYIGLKIISPSPPKKDIFPPRGMSKFTPPAALRRYNSPSAFILSFKSQLPLHLSSFPLFLSHFSLYFHMPFFICFLPNLHQLIFPSPHPRGKVSSVHTPGGGGGAGETVTFLFL
jgi:hypothetical protein